MIYPTIYLVRDKSIESYKIEGMNHYAEIFELNVDDFSLSFDTKEEFSLGSLGIRSFERTYAPKIIPKVEKYADIIFLSQKLYDRVKEDKNFKGYLFIRSDVDQKFYKFYVKPFVLHDNSKWILFENSAAKKIFQKAFFTKVSFYPTKEYNLKLLKKRLEKNFSNIIYTWDEHIPLSSRALKESLFFLFLCLSGAIVILSISSILFFSRELFDDVLHLTQYAFFYGYTLLYVYLSYMVIVGAIFIGIIISSYSGAFFLNDILTRYLWDVASYHNEMMLFMIIVGAFALFALAIFALLYRLYYKSFGIYHA
ncbi:hypothetical protein MNB_SM-7-1380 [hydrothermal vent metagenome]|uniref:Uncharacterized protein n=1 Tax=hydrothermal vent metagenome TaxID=652676 RepID=A0A1W1BYQ4_9ZZZZ